MKTHLAYGKTGLEVNLDPAWNVQVVEPRFIPGVADPMAALRQALRQPLGCPPLAELVRPGQQVGVIVNDITRPTPNPLILRALLAELSFLPKEQITLFIALGTHRPNTGQELAGMIGTEHLEGYRIVQNDCFDPSTQVCLGEASTGNEIWVNRALAECDVRILTGFIEPHFFAGFSGGGKAIMPGMGGLPTILRNHSAANIAHPKATWGNTWGNPIWEEVREIAHKVGVSFLVNVTLNSHKEITAVFAGEMDQAHAAGCAFEKDAAMAPVEQPFDVVVTTNSGYPLDLNLYQSVKGMSAAVQVVRPGGAIVIAAECWDGIPDHGLFGQMLRESDSHQAILDMVHRPGFLKQDQWQAQVLAQICLKAEVYVYSGFLTAEQIRLAKLQPAASIEATLAELVARYGPDARICILPEGPQTIPYIRS